MNRKICAYWELNSGSGDITVSYNNVPEDMKFNSSSGSEDISTILKAVQYATETSSLKQGIVGEGTYILNISSNSGTIVVK